MNIECVVGDNASVNRRFCNLIQQWLLEKKGIRRVVPFLGDAAHKLNLAVKKLFESGSENDRLIKKVKAQMVELKTLKNSYKLSSKTPLTPKLSNDTRWNSEHDMLERFITLAPILPTSNFSYATLDMIPENSETRAIDGLVKSLGKCKVASKFLQNQDPAVFNMITARLCFDDLIWQYPTFEEHLGKNASIVHSPDFESGVIKIMSGDFKLSTREKSALKMFEIGATSGSSIPVVATADDAAEETDAQKWIRQAEYGS